MKRFIILILLVFILMGCSGQMNAKEIAKTVVNRLKEIRTLRCTLIFKEGNITEVQYCVLKMPDKAYTVFKNGEIFIRNGSRFWDCRGNVCYLSYSPKVNVYREVYKHILDVLKGGKVESMGVRVLNGSKCYVLRIRNSSIAEVWIDERLMFPVLIKGRNGFVEFENLSINEPVNDSIFLPPRNAKIVNATVSSPTSASPSKLFVKSSPVSIFKFVGVVGGNSSSLSSYLSFIPKIPRGWRAVNGSVMGESITLLCERNGSFLEVLEAKGENISARNYTLVNGVKVYEFNVGTLISGYGFKLGDVCYTVFPLRLENLTKLMTPSEAVDLVEFGYKIPVRLVRLYKVNGTRVKAVVERLFGHEVYIPLHSATIFKKVNESGKLYVRAGIEYVYIGRGYVKVVYNLEEYWFGNVKCKGNVCSSESWSVSAPVEVFEFLKGSIPANASMVRIGSKTVWVVRKGGMAVSVYLRRDNLLLKIQYFSGPVPRKYYMTFLKYFINNKR